MAPSFTISKITLADCSGFRLAVDTVAREKKYLIFLEAPPLVETIAYLKSNLGARNPHFIVKHEGQIIGWCDIVRKSQPAQNHCGILGIGLLPDYRGQGLGKELLETTIAEAAAQGMSRIELTVHAGNNRAHALYLACGFREEGRMVNAVKIDGQFIDSIIMAKLI